MVHESDIWLEQCEAARDIALSGGVQWAAYQTDRGNSCSVMTTCVHDQRPVLRAPWRLRVRLISLIRKR